MQKSVLIVSLAEDLHALVVQAAVRQRGHICHLLESDHISGRESINVHISGRHGNSTIVRTSGGKALNLNSVNTIWWRRFKAEQQIDLTRLTEDQKSLINNDCYGALYGSILNIFDGRWISTPAATEFASNKLCQLQAAKQAGFQIPDTVITQSPSVVQEFRRRHNGQIIVKPVVGTPGPLIFTQFVRDEHVLSEESILSCPAIYQEYISGTRHIRLNCFGNRSFAGLIETAELDWRPNLNVPISKWSVPDTLHRQVRRALDILGLEMGVIDLKLAPTGDFVWLEVNPQGQFLFLEGITGENLTEHFADFLVQ